MGVPAAFCYIAPWSGGVFMVGDSRLTEVYKRDSERLLEKLSYDDPQDTEYQKQFLLPKLPALLKMPNGQTLKSIVTAIAKDLRVSWDGKFSKFWPTVYESPKCPKGV